MGLCASHRCAVRLLLALIMFTRAHQALSARWLPAEGSIQEKLSGNGRKLLSCLALATPTYTSKYKSQNGLPFCSTQYANVVPGGDWVAVTAETKNTMLQATSADLAYAWYTNPDNPRTDSTLQCSGEVNTTKTRCWGGNRVYTNTTFSMVSCCSTQQFCYIKSGGCVL